jgi:hypothetical protein
MTNNKKFARKCSVTGVGMNEGYCFFDGEEYAADENSALKLAKEYGYETLEEAWADDAYYWTEWDELYHDGYYTKDGEWVDTE